MLPAISSAVLSHSCQGGAIGDQSLAVMRIAYAMRNSENRLVATPMNSHSATLAAVKRPAPQRTEPTPPPP